MHIYVDDAWMTLAIGAVVFLVLFLPGLVWQYRRLGRFSAARMLGWAATCFYFSGLVIFTTFPMPSDMSAYCASHAPHHFNLRPGAILQEAARLHQETGSLRAVLGQKAILEALFNVVLFLPFGVILRRYLDRGVVFTTLAGMGASILIEVGQYTAGFGLFECQYRFADVDDVICNTAGALLGAVVAPAILFWMPSGRKLAESRLLPRPLTSRRRWLGMALDFVLWNLTALATRFACLLTLAVVDGQNPLDAPLDSDGGASVTLVSLSVATLLVFLVPAASGRGASLGQSAVWLTPKWLSRTAAGWALGNGSPVSRVCRSLVAPILLTGWVAADLLPGVAQDAVGIASGIGLLACVGLVPFTRTHRSLSGVLWRAYFLDARDPRAGGVDDAPAPVLDRHDADELGIALPDGLSGPGGKGKPAAPSSSMKSD